MSSEELHSFTDEVEPPAKRLRLDDAAGQLPSTFDAPPLTLPDEPATPSGEAVTAQGNVPPVIGPFYDAGEAEEPGDTLAALSKSCHSFFFSDIESVRLTCTVSPA